MKILLILMSLIYTLMAVDAHDAAFALDFEDNYKTALEKAKKEKKTLMLVIVQNPCPYCSALVEETFEDAAVKKALDNYVSVIIDKKGEMPEDFRVPAVPMTFFIDPKIEKSIYKSLGYSDAIDFVKILELVNTLGVRKIK